MTNKEILKKVYREKHAENLDKVWPGWKEELAWVIEAMDEYAIAKEEWDKFKSLYIAAHDLLHLHMCKLESIGSGQPTTQQWIKAVNKLSEAFGKEVTDKITESKGTFTVYEQK